MSARPDRTSRILGLIVGLAVGSLFSAAVVAAQAAGASVSAILVLPILATGALGGWLTGPLAVVPRGRLGWLRLVVGFALLAVVLGDVLVAAGLLIGSGATPTAATGVPAVVGATIGEAVGVLEIVLLGLVGFGWLALPFTLAASAIWTAVMRGLSTRLQVVG